MSSLAILIIKNTLLKNIFWKWINNALQTSVQRWLWFRNSKKANFWNLKTKLLWYVGNIINFNHPIQKSIQIHFVKTFRIQEVAPFCLFYHFLLFFCSDIIQIFICILIGGTLWTFAMWYKGKWSSQYHYFISIFWQT